MSCVDFVERKTEYDYIDIKPGNICWTNIGKTLAVTPLSLNKKGCMLTGVIQHEVFHALGFNHEILRPDRDHYVKIVYENIQPVALHRFDIEDCTDISLPYDYDSVMHFGRSEYSVDGKETVVPILDPAANIGQHVGVSPLDIIKLNKLYNCSLCRILVTGSSGTISSESNPSLYPPSVSCLYMIRIPFNRIFLSFEDFDLQDSANCSSDYIRVYDGANTSCHILLNKICGDTLPFPLLSSSNVMLLEFVSDDSLAGTGFKVSYTNVTHGSVHWESPGIIHSPGYPSPYPNNVKSLHKILAPQDYKDRTGSEEKMARRRKGQHGPRDLSQRTGITVYRYIHAASDL
ncbi:embryonic protein UVS.2-like isoform X2 [Hyperolius riggenbachi]|uniref:embryonic protein UVS.2-like isoform X2 n=1 Tax=Hyperolius riggenbachi TaxID=752182 RepID=UPI0035A2AC81